MSFQLFFPGKSVNAGACLQGVGLADFVDGASETSGVVAGVPGLCVGWGSRIGVDESRQRWIESVGYKIGFWTDIKFSPDQIARRSLFDGYDVELSDGNRWRVPVATDLPATLRLVDSRWTKVRKPQFTDFWCRSEEWFRRYTLFQLDEQKMADDAKLPVHEILNQWIEFVVFALRQNYRVTPQIVSELGILDVDCLYRVTLSVIDGMNIQAVWNELEALNSEVEAGLKKSEEVLHIPV